MTNPLGTTHKKAPDWENFAKAILTDRPAVAQEVHND